MVEVLCMKDEQTKRDLAEALLAVMEHQPLEKITVNDIVTKCGVSRQTFYRHFKDKYDLVNWYFEIQVQKSFALIKDSRTLIEALTKKFEFINEQYVFFRNAFMIDNCNSLVNYDYNYIYHFYESIIVPKVGTITDDIRFTLEFYCHASIDMTVEWVRNDRPVKPSIIAERLVELMPKKLEQLLVDL